MERHQKSHTMTNLEDFSCLLVYFDSAQITKDIERENRRNFKLNTVDPSKVAQ
jgi:hypothetical protein